MTLKWDDELLAASRKCDIDSIQKLTADKSYTNAELLQAAMQATIGGHVEVLQSLLDHHWDVAADKDGESPLVYAVRSKNTEIATWLLEHGANPNTTDEKGLTIITIAALTCPGDMLLTLVKHGALMDSRAVLAAAVSKTSDRVSKLSFLLDQKGVEINQPVLELPGHVQNGQPRKTTTALQAACRWGYEDSEALLLEKGADANVLDHEGLSIDELKAIQSRYAYRGWSRGQLSENARARIAEETRQKKDKQDEGVAETKPDDSVATLPKDTSN